MTAYLAVVKYAVDDPPEAKRRALLDGLGMISMELVAEHDFSPEQIERALEEAYSEAEYEHQLKREREEDE